VSGQSAGEGGFNETLTVLCWQVWRWKGPLGGEGVNSKMELDLHDLCFDSFFILSHFKWNFDPRRLVLRQRPCLCKGFEISDQITNRRLVKLRL
jgi:hypothetical protein